MVCVELCFVCVFILLQTRRSLSQRDERAILELGFSPAKTPPSWMLHTSKVRHTKALTEHTGVNANITSLSSKRIPAQLHRWQTAGEMEIVGERRLSAATVLGPTHAQISGRWASNIAMARLTSSKAVLVYSDYEFYFQGRVVICEVASGSLVCGASSALTSVPIHTDAHSLAIDSIWTDQVIFAWKEGVSPFVGHVQACMSDLSSCGPELRVKVEWGSVEVLALAQRIIVFAYIDLQKGHRGSIVRCDVANMNLNCDLAKVFEAKPISSLALGAMTSDTLPYSSETADMVIAYQVSSQTENFGCIQPCMLASDSSSLTCYSTSSKKFTDARTDGMSMTTFSADAFVIGYADRGVYCPPTNRQSRRRALQVCTVADGHPSIGRLKLCRATFRGLGISNPLLECSESGIIDDGYATGVPHVIKRDGTPTLGQSWNLLAIYSCTGCDDLGALGWARSCVAGPMSAQGFAIAPPGCFNRLEVNNDTMQWPKIVAIDGGYLAAYNNYGGSQYLTVRMIT